MVVTMTAVAAAASLWRDRHRDLPRSRAWELAGRHAELLTRAVFR